MIPGVFVSELYDYPDQIPALKDLDMIPSAAFPLDIAKAHYSLDQPNHHPQSIPSHSQRNGRQHCRQFHRLPSSGAN